MELLAAAIPLAILAFAIEGVPHIEWSALLVVIVAYQGLAATAFAVWAQVTVLRSLPAITTNLTLMMIPLVGVVASALIVGEQITPVLMTALVLIFAGVSLNLFGDLRGAQPPTNPAQ